MDTWTIVFVTQSPTAEKVLNKYLKVAEAPVRVQVVANAFHALHMLHPTVRKRVMAVVFDCGVDESELLRTVNDLGEMDTENQIIKLILCPPETFPAYSEKFSGLARCLIVNEIGIVRFLSLGIMLEEMYLKRIRVAS